MGDAKELSSIGHTSDEDSWELFEQRKKRSIFGRRKSTYTLRGEGYLEEQRRLNCKHHKKKEEVSNPDHGHEEVKEEEIDPRTLVLKFRNKIEAINLKDGHTAEEDAEDAELANQIASDDGHEAHSHHHHSDTDEEE